MLKKVMKLVMKSFWMYQVVEDAKLDEVWSFEGQREADANTIEVMFYLK